MRKIVAKNFVGALIPGDRAGVVDFDSYAYLIRPLTDDFNAVNASIDSLDAWGGTNIGAGVSAANSHLISAGNTSHAWMMILLTDGEGYYHDYYTQQAVANNITIYTIGLGSSVDSVLLTGITTATGGQYYLIIINSFLNLITELEGQFVYIARYYFYETILSVLLSASRSFSKKIRSRIQSCPSHHPHNIFIIEAPFPSIPPFSPLFEREIDRF
ncbi:uncharacterized protein containing a von Willebrand factor type A (vWA) domain [Candidatus Methanoperedens nitroreducens]|uniref:Uncharacterized protein containing a von Willebrand factor type A (VWA) domain n=1 Tax=Candidatus Methanoperedens nitratireducens TaxID=1392998 RepID=A0A062V987_9EURY|nr:vWA domain-containing protein [Candidatus Methanoperedens nitroreducens]KCZ72319.1 uncharacterized protein containing a von Willebrand factor type A (vWA) domain [Candidatus Methanoperedens nitroreducens]MDJ1420784.1 vWA domain-containing protein [Candidatus Methanoperedens sp.]